MPGGFILDRHLWVLVLDDAEWDCFRQARLLLPGPALACLLEMAALGAFVHCHLSLPA